MAEGGAIKFLVEHLGARRVHILNKHGGPSDQGGAEQRVLLGQVAGVVPPVVTRVGHGHVEALHEDNACATLGLGRVAHAEKGAVGAQLRAH